MKGKVFWFFLSGFVICAVIAFANNSATKISLVPQQQLLTQCADEILDPDLCIYQYTYERECCIPNPWHKAVCQMVDFYRQFRPPPQRPSGYYANRRHCPSAGQACTPMPKLHCPTP